jgi:hypothetical protein
MTANVKIPIASADNVTSVPLAAVFTEKNPDNGQMERFVYIQQEDGFEKRNVKVGVSDFFNAEIQEGLKEGEIVSLEMPKEEREKKARQLAVQHANGEDKTGSKQPGGGSVKGSKSTGGDSTPKTKSAAAATSKDAGTH